jgi:Bacterial capsule synthesis protein PGA_cap
MPDGDRPSRAKLALGAAAAALAVVAGLALGCGRREEPARTPAAAATATATATPARGRRPSAVTIAWVGDTTPGTTGALPPGDGRERYRAVAGRLRRADLAVGNLEGTLAVGGASKCAAPSAPAAAAVPVSTGGTSCFAFRAPPRYARGLEAAGFDLMNLANNHAFDYGARGMGQTVRALERRGVAVTGRPGEVRVLRRNGVRVAFAGFAAYRWASPIRDLAAVRSIIAGAARKADVVVALMHAGAEGEVATRVPVGEEVAYGEARGDPRAFARAAIDAGADLVLGSGPHVVRGLQRYRGRLIAHSLGNFHGVGNFAAGPVASLSGLLEVRVRPDGRVAGGRWRSLRLVDGGRPVPDPRHASAKLVRRLSAQDFGRAAWRLEHGGRLR